MSLSHSLGTAHGVGLERTLAVGTPWCAPWGSHPGLTALSPVHTCTARLRGWRYQKPATPAPSRANTKTPRARSQPDKLKASPGKKKGRGERWGFFCCLCSWDWLAVGTGVPVPEQGLRAGSSGSSTAGLGSSRPSAGFGCVVAMQPPSSIWW